MFQDLTVHEHVWGGGGKKVQPLWRFPVWWKVHIGQSSSLPAGVLLQLLPAERLVLGRTTVTNQDLNPDVRAALLNSWEKEESAALVPMERLGLAVFWCATIIFGSVLLREAGESTLSLTFSRKWSYKHRVDMCDTWNTLISWKKLLSTATWSSFFLLRKFSSPAAEAHMRKSAFPFNSSF